MNFSFLKKEDKRIVDREVKQQATSEDIRAMLSADEHSVSVNGRSSLTCVPYRSALNIITETASVLPIKVYRKRGDEIRQHVSNHPVQQTLRRPNHLQTTQDFLKTVIFNLMHHNQAFIRITRSGNRIIEMIPLSTDKVDYRVDDNLDVTCRVNGKIVNPDDILRIKGISEDGFNVEPRWKQAKKAISLYLNITKYGDDYFKNGAKANGYFATDEILTDDVFTRVANSIKKAVGKAHTAPLLEGGIEYKKLDSTLRDSQLSDLKKEQVAEIARAFNIPAHLIQDYSGSSYNSIEALGIEFMTLCLLPIINNIETSINTFLITDDDVYCEFEVNAFLRADVKSRHEAYKTQIHVGIRSVNEVRKLENLAPVENGDLHQYGLNLGFLEKFDPTNQQPIQPINTPTTTDDE